MSRTSSSKRLIILFGLFPFPIPVPPLSVFCDSIVSCLSVTRRSISRQPDTARCLLPDRIILPEFHILSSLTYHFSFPPRSKIVGWILWPDTTHTWIALSPSFDFFVGAALTCRSAVVQKLFMCCRILSHPAITENIMTNPGVRIGFSLL